MIILVCNDCGSAKVTRYEGKMAEKGYDWFKCESCNHNFPLKKADYREENNLFE